MGKWNLSDPSGGFKHVDHLGHVLLFVSPQLVEETGAFGDQQVARCAYVCCITEGTAQPDAKVYGKVLAPRVAEAGEELVVGVLEQGTAKPGMSPPWILANANAEEKASAEAFLEARFTRSTATGGILYAGVALDNGERF